MLFLSSWLTDRRAAYPEGSRTTVALPSEHDMAFTEPELTTSDGVKLKAFLMLASSDARGPRVSESLGWEVLRAAAWGEGMGGVSKEEYWQGWT